MATLSLQSLGASMGQALTSPLASLLGQTTSASATKFIDNTLFPTKLNHVHSSKVANLLGLASQEGGYIPRIYGRARIGGQLIWATRFEEVATLNRAGLSGGKGLSSVSTSSQSSTTYTYFANFAIAICEGPITFIRRIWGDSHELDLTLYTYRIYKGSEDQLPDSLISAKEGADQTPSYKGTAYIVFEQFPLAQFGNRIPQFSFEVVKSINGLAPHIQSIHIIPAATEYGYSTQTLIQNLGLGVSETENRHILSTATDWQASLDALQALCPNLQYVSLVVSWFADDLRADNCHFLPRVESYTKSVPLMNWSVGAFNRASVPLLSQINNQSAYGGTPCDKSVIQALTDLTSRGLKVTFYPFVMMDIPANNNLPDPVSGQIGQPAYPWRGRIVPNLSSSLSVDEQINLLFNGPNGYRAFILHYAQLCSQFTNIDCFLLGSELIGLSHARHSDGSYPFAHYLILLLRDVRAILGSKCKLSYGADWTEYSTAVWSEGANIDFPLDLFWSDNDVDFVGLDIYWPLTDWRDGQLHLDAELAPSIYDKNYLISRFNSGEAYEWYYASDHDRQIQVRTPITDGAYNKPWMFRPKDIQGWWSNQHFPRNMNQELSPTPWVPNSKPIWFLEFGCPAVDRGSNQPQVFPDEKSSESLLPYFSKGCRDDLIQKRVLESCYNFYSPSSSLFNIQNNPFSNLYQGYMLDVSRIYLWAWDSRPFPAFPLSLDVWADGQNWSTGHWLTGRLEGMELNDLLTNLILDFGYSDLSFEIDAIGFMDGFAVDKQSSFLKLVDPLSSLYSFNIAFTSGRIRLTHRLNKPILTITPDECIIDKSVDAIALETVDSLSLPKTLTLNLTDSTYDFRQMSVLAQVPVVVSKHESVADIAVLTFRSYAKQLAEIWLNDLWAGRSYFKFNLSKKYLSLEVGDNIILERNDMSHLIMITNIVDTHYRSIEARSLSPDIYNYRESDISVPVVSSPKLPGPGHFVVLDLALARQSPLCLQYLAVYADPWPTSFALYLQNGQSFTFNQTISKPSNIGTTQNIFTSGPTDIFDMHSVLIVTCPFALSSVSILDVFNGKNYAAVLGDDQQWEIIAFCQATLIAPSTYKLSQFLRGLGGQDYLAQRTVQSGATFVLLDDTIISLASGTSMLGITQTWRLGPSSRNYGDDTYLEFEATPTSLALKPYPPRHLSALKNNNDIIINFMRSGRIDADGWEPIDIPLGEDSLLFELDVMRDGKVVRTLTSSSQQIIYASFDQISDFGSLVSSLSIQIYQISSIVGRGFPATGQFNFT